MPRLKTIKLNKKEKKEIDKLQREKTIAKYGVETANNLHFAAGERLWQALWGLYPETVGGHAVYDEGVITYTPKGEK